MSSPQPPDDRSLARNAAAGDTVAFEMLLQRHQKKVVMTLYRFTSVRPDLEDMVQDTFIRAWRNINQWEERSPFLHWLLRIATRVALEYCRKKSRSPLDNTVLDGMGQAEDRAMTFEARPGSPEDARAILGALPPEDRLILTLQYLEELSARKIAARTGWSIANVKIKAFRARNRLRAQLRIMGITHAR